MKIHSNATTALTTSILAKIIVFMSFVFLANSIPDSRGAVNVTIRVKNTDPAAAHSFCIQYYRSGSWHDLFAANVFAAGGINTTYSAP
jgi:hypothetical protein